MATRPLEARPSPGTEDRSGSRARTIGLTLGSVGVVLVTVTLVNAISAGILAGRSGEGSTVAELLAWSFGVTTTGFGMVKVAIGAILVGILARLWRRVDAVKDALPALMPVSDGGAVKTGAIGTPFGRATVTTRAPRALRIHVMARAMWAPMLVMGAMAVLAGLVLSLVQTGDIGADPALATSRSAWVQGLQFLGEGLLLSGISFLLGTILGALRAGGGEVQGSVGVGIQTLDMPTTAKVFIGLMAVGLMVEIFQFVVYVVVSTFDDPGRVAAYFAWLGRCERQGWGSSCRGSSLHSPPSRGPSGSSSGVSSRSSARDDERRRRHGFDAASNHGPGNGE